MRRTQRVSAIPILLVGCAAFCRPTIGGAAEPRPRSVPNDEAPARFIPASALAAAEPADVDVATARDQIASRAALVKEQNRRCAIQVNMDGSGPPGEAPEDRLRSFVVVVKGEVSALEPGWDPQLGQAVTRVKIQVREVLAGRLPEHAEISYIQPFGSFYIAERQICTLPQFNDFRAGVGDELLLGAGGVDSSGRLGVPSWGIYLIAGGRAFAFGARGAASDGVPLDSIRTILSRRHAQ